MRTPLEQKDDNQRQSEAAAWVLRLQEPDLSEATTIEWLGWCEAEPRNRAAFEAMSELWSLSSKLNPHTPYERPAAQARLRSPNRFLPAWPLALAASLLLMLGAGLLLHASPFADGKGEMVARLETTVGHVQATRMEDGSKIELGGSSALSVRYTRDNRTVIAEKGEAYFEVAKNAERPFIVEAGPLKVTAVGTAFSVQRDEDAVSVLVTEGVVEVETAPILSAGRSIGKNVALLVSAGHRVRLDKGELIRSTEPVAGDVVASWREGRLEFRDEPLRLVVARINRYSARKLEISDPSIAGLRVTSTIYKDRLDAWLTGIEAVLPVRASRHGNWVLISPANAPVPSSSS